MTKIFLEVNGTHAVASADGKLTSGMVGLPVTIDYDDSWDGLTKTAFFRVGNSVRKRDSVGTYTEVPWEILRTHGNVLEIGIEGKNENGSVVIPTTWAVVSKIQQGAQGDIPAAPKPGVDQPSEGAGANIDDSQISSSTTWSSEKIDKEIKNGKSEIIKDNLISYNSCWSSKNTVDNLCTAFMESGSVVQCEPVEGYPMEVISTINPKDSGDTWGKIKLYHSGKNLAPNVSRTLNKTGITIEFIDNILKINGTGGRNLGGYSADYAFTLPAGTYTWSLTHVSGTCTYSGSSGTFYLRTSTGYVSVKDMYGALSRNGTFTLTEPTSLCFEITTAGSSTYENLTFTFQVEIGNTATAFEPYTGTTVYTADFSNYGLLDAGSYNWTTGVLINEAGNHYQHDLETNTFEMVDETEHIPRRVRNIHAYPGVNTLISDCGDTAVSGKADPVAIIEKLTNAIIALGGNV